MATADGMASRQDVLDLARTFGPDVILLDLHLGADVGDSIPLIQPLGSSGATVIVLSGEKDPALLGMCLEAGAASVAGKTQSIEDVVDLVDRAVRAEPILPPQRRQELLAALYMQRREEAERLRVFAALTPRERAVLDHLMNGRSAQAVAAASYVSIATVRSQIRSILQKLQVGTQMEAVALARRSGWTHPER